MANPFTERDRNAVVSFLSQCEQLMSKGTVDGWSIARRPDDAALVMHVGGAALTGKGPTLAEALVDMGKILVERFRPGTSVNPTLVTRIPFSTRDDAALNSFIQHAERLIGRRHADGWSVARGPDNAAATLVVGDLALTGTGATIAEATKDLSRVLTQTFPRVSDPPS